MSAMEQLDSIRGHEQNQLVLPFVRDLPHAWMKDSSFDFLTRVEAI
jgi:hypothetical protein